MRPSRILAAGFAVALSLALPLAAAADWLVTKDGGRVETRGPWEIKGAQVIFYLTNGTLSSMRLRDVDLDASAVATAEARAPRPAPPPAKVRKKKTPVLVLTDEDIKRATPEEDPNAAGGVAPPPAEEKDLRVASWWRVEDPGVTGVEIRGALRNFGTDFALELNMSVAVNADGEEQQTQAFLDETDLAPGGLTDFRAVFPDLTSFEGEPSFDVQHATVTLDPENPQETRSSDGESDESDEDDVKG